MRFYIGARPPGTKCRVLVPEDTSTYETVRCMACTRVHLINPATGHVVGINSKPAR
jgi:hypothetical protein